MSEIQKLILPKKINTIMIKLKSYAFMKIFMVDEVAPKRFHKIRHYDLELEGANAITCWMKKRLQQVYLRQFYQIKNYSEQGWSETSIKEAQSTSLQFLQLQSNQKKLASKYRPQTDRQPSQQHYATHRQRNAPSSYSTQVLQHPQQKSYKSEFGQSQLSQNTRKSKLQSLLNKVREVNTHSRVTKNKENDIKDNTVFDISYQNSRVKSNVIFRQDYRKSNQRNYPQHSTRVISNHNDMSFCTYGKTERPVTGSRGFLNNVRHSEIPAQSSVTYRMNVQQEASIDKNNLNSLKKWHRNQKRNVIMAKINELENSLFAEHQGRDEYFYNDEEMYGGREMYEFAPNYSQGYLHMQTARHAPRSVMDVRRKF